VFGRLQQALAAQLDRLNAADRHPSFLNAGARGRALVQEQPI
jgi:hypothetical protein